MQSAYDDYADKIKEQLKELETSPGNVLEQLEPQRLVPERGNDGIGGRERKKVSVMGAKLDADVAGALVLDAKPPEEEHERLFQLGVRSMRAGEYKKASTAFTQAVAAFPGGMTTRRGGEYSVWLAQALHAQGGEKRGAAMRLLKKCEAHPDKDVRTLSDNVLYIFQAPELKLSEENFMKIEMPDTSDDWDRKRIRPKEEKDPPPEKYSVEWYLERARETERSKATPDASRSGGSVAALALLAAASTAALVLF